MIPSEDILKTVEMIQIENLDVRTVTLPIIVLFFASERLLAETQGIVRLGSWERNLKTGEAWNGRTPPTGSAGGVREIRS